MSAADERLEERILLPGRQARLVGHVAVREQILQAFVARRAHHAWLLSGPAGVGKATLAWHLARLLLAYPGRTLADAPQHGLAETHPVFQRMAAGAHADFFVLRRQRDARSKRLRARIVVEDARALGHFLALKSASGGRRVVIVDAADEMNRETANAILKLLEEPPSRTHFFLISHAPGRLLPTIRSRCLHVRLAPLPEKEVREVLAVLPVPWLQGVAAELLELAVAMSGGSPGRALDLATSRALPLWQEVRAALDGGDARAMRQAAMRAGQTLAAATARADLALFVELLTDWGSTCMRQAAARGQAAAAARWAELLAEVSERQVALEAVNLDRRQFVEAVLQRLFEMPRNLSSAC